MSITANSSRPKPPRPERRSNLTWIFFLLILARPLWGILRSTVGAHVSNAQLWIIVVGVITLGLVGLLVSRAMDGRSSAPRLPAGAAPTRPLKPINIPTPTTSTYPAGPPRFEPIITGKVVLAGFALATLIGVVGVLLWLA